jgi:hypothetical protein
MTDLFGVAGLELLTRVTAARGLRGLSDSLRRVMDTLEFEIDVFANLVRARLSTDPGYTAVQTIPRTCTRCSAMPVSASSPMDYYCVGQVLVVEAEFTRLDQLLEGREDGRNHRQHLGLVTCFGHDVTP